MKRLVIVVMVLMSVSGQALAGSWVGVLGPSYGGGIYCGSWRGVSGNYSSYGGYGGYGYGRDRTLGRVVGYSGLAMDVFGTISQISASDRMLEMAEREQMFRHQLAWERFNFEREIYSRRR